MPDRRRNTKRLTATGGTIREVERQRGTVYQVHYNSLQLATYDTREAAEARLVEERAKDVRPVLETKAGK